VDNLFSGGIFHFTPLSRWKHGLARQLAASTGKAMQATLSIMACRTNSDFSARFQSRRNFIWKFHPGVGQRTNFSGKIRYCSYSAAPTVRAPPVKPRPQAPAGRGFHFSQNFRDRLIRLN
jgi:hypothetical protein